MEEYAISSTIDSSRTPSTDDSLVDIPKMKLVYFGNEFPRDDLQDLFRRLYHQSQDRKHPILARFIQEATLAAREEVRCLPATLKSLVPPFDTIFDLADHPDLPKSPLGGSVVGMLLCAVQLAALIGYYENTPGDYYNWHTAGTCLTGLGTGLLSTAAVALSPTLADVPVAGSEVIRVAFRLGVQVDQVSRNLQPRSTADGPGDSWAYVVPNAVAKEVQAELDSIQAVEKIPEPSKVFISALSRTSVTVSGPPARLKHIFLVSDYFRDRRSISLPVFGGLCHAKHIYSKKHVENVVDTASMGGLDPKFTAAIPVLSTSTGSPFPAKTPGELFSHIAEEIMTQAIQWDKVVQSIVAHAKQAEVAEYAVYTFRNSLPGQDLVEALETESQEFSTKSIDLIPWVLQPNTPSKGPRSPQQSKIAIVGVSCRLPGGASDPEKFWEVLDQGLDVHRKVPADRFDVDSHTDPTGKRVNTSLTPYGCFIDEPGLFDAPFFNMSPREALQTDPMQRLAIVTAYEALERAGYVANRTSSTSPSRIGTFYGQASDDYREVNTAQEVGTYFITGGCRAFGPGRVNYFFKFSGPSYSIDTACSSGLATIHVACNSLWQGDTDMAVAGGMNVLTNSDAFAGLSKGHFLSKTPNACKTWDSEADGYCRADGVVSIILKRLEDAEAENDNILGVILAAGTNHSAEAISITHPHAGHQADLTKHILKQAAVDPLDISYVEMHGTGTQAGDAQEIQSVCNVFAPLTSAKHRQPSQPLHIGAVKSNVGHGEAVAGSTALLKLLLMFEKEAIPRHVGIKNSINPGFPADLARRNLHIPFEKIAWPRVEGRRRIAVVNNFSAAGGNTSVIVEEGPLRQMDDSARDPRGTHVIAISAKSKVSFKGNLQSMISYLDEHPQVNLSDLAYTTTARRYHHNHRIAIATSDVAHLRRQLGTCLENAESHKPIPPTGPPPVVFAFTGQGSSYRSMDLQLYRDSPCFRQELLLLDSLAQSQGFPSFIPAIDGSHPRDHAHSPTITQLALVCTEITLAKFWESLGVRPDVVVGHSLGEYAALHVAGVLSAADTVFLVGQRAKMLESKCKLGSHKMLAVRASLEEIRSKANGKPFEVACINGPKDTVLGGTSEQVQALVEELEGNGKLKCVALDVAFAFHSAQTEPILDELEEMAGKGALFQPPTLPIISPLLGKVIFDEKTVNAKYIRRATREAVNFLDAVETAHAMSTVDETMVWVEIGPHPVCVGFVGSILPATSINAAVPSFRRGEDSWKTLSGSLATLHAAGVQVDWNEFHRPFEGGLRLLDLPTYAWNDKTHWVQYNGDWALTKGNTFYDEEKAASRAVAESVNPLLTPRSSLRTSLVHRVVEESFSGSAGRVIVQSDMMHSDFLAAAWGHQMNGAGVVTSSIHADLAWTLGKYLLDQLKPNGSKTSDVSNMNIVNLSVREGLVAQKNTKVPQLIQVTISTNDIDSGTAELQWHSVANDGCSLVEEEPIVTAQIEFGSARDWLSSWAPSAHLIQGRIEALSRLVQEGRANRFSHSMAYLLFANNLVDYADKYRGMQSVEMHGLEAYADITIKPGDAGGAWTVPPFFIDSVFHLGGFVMNVSDAIDTKNNFCVTPGWSSLRLARPLAAGGKYRSYVKMIPTAEDPCIYLGDVYVLEGDEIIGLMQAMKFRRYPRVLLNRFFSAADVKNPATGSVAAAGQAPVSLSPPVVATTTKVALEPRADPPPAPAPIVVRAKPAESKDHDAAKTAPGPAAADNLDSIAVKALALVAAEAALEPADLQDGISFGDLGVDSLMSLVIAEKLREELNVTVSGSLFLGYPTVGDLRAWLVEYYG